MASRQRLLILYCFLTMVAGAAFAQRADSASNVDAAAAAALDTMGAYLRSLPAFQVQAVTSVDDVLDDGEKVQYGASVDLLIRRPDRFRAEVTGDKQQRFFFYDGKSFTMWAPRLNFYATAPAPPTLGKLSGLLEERYGIELPLTDLFRWGTDAANPAPLVAAFDAGPSQVGGTTCEHYVFRQPGLDWQVWIQQGDYPLPRRLVITATDDDARPTYVSEMTWNLAPSFNEAAFLFTPDPGTMKITFAEAKARREK